MDTAATKRSVVRKSASVPPAFVRLKASRCERKREQTLSGVFSGPLLRYECSPKKRSKEDASCHNASTEDENTSTESERKLTPDYSQVTVETYIYPFKAWDGTIEPYTYYAIAVSGNILWDTWSNGSQVPSLYTSKRQDLEELIQKRHALLQAVLTETPEEKAVRVAAREASMMAFLAGLTNDIEANLDDDEA